MKPSNKNFGLTFAIVFLIIGGFLITNNNQTYLWAIFLSIFMLTLTFLAPNSLSIPNIREDVSRHEIVTLEYQDENFNTHTETFNGITARVILHEFDHIEGKLFIDYLKPLRKKLLQGKLNDISKGKTRIDYKMIFIK